MAEELVEVEVDCPQCGNANRAARRLCKGGRGMCNGTGKVTKWLPVEAGSDPATP